MPDTPIKKPSVFYIQGDIKDTQRKVRIAAAESDMAIKDYVVALFEEAEPNHPLELMRAAMAAATREGKTLEKWVEAQRK